MIIKDLSLSFINQEIFKDINLYIPENEKVGLIGSNGAGKTTFFKIILGLIEPDAGKIKLNRGARISWLPQVIYDEVPNSDVSVLDFLLEGRPISKIEMSLEKLYREVADEKDLEAQSKMLKKIGNLQHELEYWDVYEAENILLKIISGMKIDSSLLDQPLKTLSGGQKSKVAFARLLYSKPEIILLDEPTNHLDIETKDYIIDFLKNYNGTILIISHDIELLNKVTTKTINLDKQTHQMTIYNGNYSTYKKLMEEHEKALEGEALKQSKEIAKLQAIVNLYSNSSGKRKRMAQDREKKLAKLKEKIIEMPTETKKVKLDINAGRTESNIPIKVKDLSFSYNKASKTNIINHLSFEIHKGEKFLIVGENGVGKSTLLKLIVGSLIPDEGEIILGPKTDIGYYAQEHELLDNDKSMADNFTDLNIEIKQLRSILGRFLFHGDDIYKKVGILSPGERSRVALAKLALMKANLLILDEPTNHLDPETQAIIAETFKDFKGTMIIVSHNTEFVDHLGVERTLILPSGKLSYYDKKVVEHFQILNTPKRN